MVNKYHQLIYISIIYSRKCNTRFFWTAVAPQRSLLPSRSRPPLLLLGRSFPTLPFPLVVLSVFRSFRSSLFLYFALSLSRSFRSSLIPLVALSHPVSAVVFDSALTYTSSPQMAQAPSCPALLRNALQSIFQIRLSNTSTIKKLSLKLIVLVNSPL